MLRLFLIKRLDSPQHHVGGPFINLVGLDLLSLAVGVNVGHQLLFVFYDEVAVLVRHYTLLSIVYYMWLVAFAFFNGDPF